MTALLLALIILITVTTFLKKNDFFHPSKIYILVYSILFLIYSLHLCRFQNSWSSTTTMLFWGGVSAFLGAGALVTFYVKHISQRFPEIENLTSVTKRLADAEKSVDWDWFFRVTAIVFCVFTGSYLYNFCMSGIIPMFSDDPNTDRFIYLSGSMFIAIAGSSGTFVMMLCAEGLLAKNVLVKHKIFFAIMLVISFGLYFSFVTRMPIVRSFIYMAVISHYMRKPVSFRAIATISVMIISFFIFGALVRVDAVQFSELAERLKINLPLQYIPFINPYAYAVNNVWNMDYGFRKFIDGMDMYHISYGFEFFRGFFFYTQLETIFQGSYGFDSLFNDSIIKIKGLNTVIYIWHFYKDFGVGGLFFVSFLLSTLIHIFYYNTLLVPSHIRIALFALIISMISFSFMVPLWSFWNIYYETALLLVAHKTIKIT